MAQAAKRKTRVTVRARSDMWDWYVTGPNGSEVCRSPGLYKHKSNAKRAGLSFTTTYLRLRKVEVVEVG